MFLGGEFGLEGLLGMVISYVLSSTPAGTTLHLFLAFLILQD